MPKCKDTLKKRQLRLIIKHKVIKVIACKTIFTRMEDIKAGKIDEDGLGINNVETALARVNVKLRDSQFEFRGMGDVLEELSGKWAGLNDLEQSNISKAIAGVRQANQFKILMMNMGDAIKYQAEQMNSGGLAADRYTIYLQGIEAAQNKMTASWDRMWSVSINSDSIKVFYRLSSAVLDLVATFGGLPTIVGVATGALILMNAAQIKVILASAALKFDGIILALEQLAWAAAGGTLGMEALTTAILANPIAWIGVAVGALAIGLGYLSQSEARASEDAKKLSDELNTIKTRLSTLNSELKTVRELGSAFDELKYKASKNTDEQSRFLEVQNKLKDMFPQLMGYYDAEGNFILDQSIDLRTLVDLKLEQVKVERDLMELHASQAMSGKQDQYAKEKKDIESLISQISAGGKREAQRFIAFSPESMKDAQDKLKELVLNSKLTESQIKETFYQMGKESQDNFIEGLKSKGDAVSLAVLELLGRSRSAMDKGERDNADYVSAIAKEYKTFADDMKSITEGMSLTGDIIGKSLSDTLDFGDVEKLIAANTDYAKLITIEDGQVKVNTADLMAYTVKKADDALASAIQNDASNETIKILAEYRYALQSGAAYAPIYAKAQEDAQKKAEDAAKKAKDAIEIQITAAKKLLDMVVNMLKERKTAEKDNLQSQLDGYKALIQARKDALDAKKAEDDYNKSIGKQSAEISTMQTQIDVLKLDTSAEAIAQRLALESDLAAKKDTLESDQSKHSVDMQKASLDEQEKAYQSFIDGRISDIDKYTSSSGKMMKDAQDMITKNSAKTYTALMKWNMTYGDGLKSTVIQAWNEGYNGVVNFQSLMNSLNTINLNPLVEQIKIVSATIANIPTFPNQDFGGGVSSQYSFDSRNAWAEDSQGNYNYGRSASLAYSRHSGVDTGFVKGVESNEEFAKLMAGELVINADQMNKFMSRTLPNLVKNGGGSGFNIGKLLEITVQGNLDSSVVPQINEIAEKVVKKINDNLKQRGFLRTTTLTSI